MTPTPKPTTLAEHKKEMFKILLKNLPYYPSECEAELILKLDEIIDRTSEAVWEAVDLEGYKHDDPYQTCAVGEDNPEMGGHDCSDDFHGGFSRGKEYLITKQQSLYEKWKGTPNV